MPWCGLDRDGVISAISLSMCKMSPGRVGRGQATSPPMPTRPFANERPPVTRSRIATAAVCQPLAAKAYVHSLGEALHYEFKPQGIYVTVVPPAPTNTPVLAKFGFDPRTMPMKPMSAEQCVSEGLNALWETGPGSFRAA